MSRICVGLLCGVPACGKTTLAVRVQEHAAQLLPAQLCVLVLHYDKLIPAHVEQQLIAQTEEQGGSLWKSMRSQILSCVERLLSVLKQEPQALAELIHADGHDENQQITHSTDQGASERQSGYCVKPAGVDSALWERFLSLLRDSLKHTSCGRSHNGDHGLCEDDPHSWLVLVDDNMHYGSMRYQYCQLVRKYEASLCVIHVTCPLEEALQRNRSRTEDRVDDSTITVMHQRLETPDPDKRPWEKYSATVSGASTIDIQLLLEMVQAALKDPQRPSPEEDAEGKVISRYVCSTNAIHQADQILRRCVSQYMVEAKGVGLSSAEMKAVSAKLTKTRTTILNDLRQGKVTLPFQLNEKDVANASKNADNPLFQFVETLFSARTSECTL